MSSQSDVTGAFLLMLQWRALVGRACFSSYARQGRLVIVGSGWGGFELLRNINRRDYEVVVVSPRNYFVFTPLLASTCVGTLEFRCVTEPIRRIDPNIKYHQAFCTDINLQAKRLTLQPVGGTSTTELEYDRLVLSCGAQSNTFGIEGVKEHAFFLKDIGDARRIRHRVLKCFEVAMQPGTTDSERRRLLHFTIVGGGPTGVEFAAELNDFVQDDMSRIYPSLREYVRITVFDVALRILGTFDEKLGDFARDRFARNGIRVETGARITKVTQNHLEIGDRLIGTGLVVWATGLAPTGLVSSLTEVQKTEKSGRLITDSHLRVKRTDGSLDDCFFALGDCGSIENGELPCTAQVAKQQAQYLAKTLNQLGASPSQSLDGLPPFQFKSLGSMAYIGGWQAIVDLRMRSTLGKDSSEGNPQVKPIRESGRLAWLFWRSAYFSMAVSWKNKILIPMYWFLTWIFERHKQHLNTSL